MGLSSLDFFLLQTMARSIFIYPSLCKHLINALGSTNIQTGIQVIPTMLAAPASILLTQGSPTPLLQGSGLMAGCS